MCGARCCLVWGPAQQGIAELPPGREVGTGAGCVGAGVWRALSLSLCLSLSLRGEEEGQRPGPPPTPARRFAHLRLLAGEDLPQGLCPRGLGCTWGLSGLNTKDCTRLRVRKIPHTYEQRLTDGRLGRRLRSTLSGPP